MEWKEKRLLMDKQIKINIIPILKEKGFKGNYPHFRRETKNKIDILGFQYSQWGPQFYIEIAISPLDGITLIDGKHFSADKVKYYHTATRIRIGKQPFDFENENYNDIIKDIVASLDEAENWWLKYSE